VPRSTWGSDTPTSTEDARERLIDAAEGCFEHYGVAKTTIEDIAATARVSRATVYRYFDGGRDEIMLEFLVREARRFLGRLAERVAHEPDTASALTEGIAFTVESATRDPTLRLLFAPEVAGQTGSIAGASTALLDLTREFLRPLVGDTRPIGRLRDGLDLDDAADYVLRIIVSLLCVPLPPGRWGDAAGLRRYILAFVVPGLGGADPQGPG